MSLGTIGVVVLGVTFVGAGWTKLRARTSFRALLRALLPDPLVAGVAVAVPVLEVAIGLALLVGLAPTVTLISSAAMLTLFSVSLVSMWRLGLTQDCGCFGEASAASTPISGLIRNAGLLGLVAAALVAPSARPVWLESAADAAVHAVVVLAVVTCWALLVIITVRRNLLFSWRVD